MSMSSVRNPEVAERYERLLEVQAVMARVSREIGPAVELQHVLRTVLGAITAFGRFAGASVWLVDMDGVHLAAGDPPPADDEPRRYRHGQSVVGWVVASGAPLADARSLSVPLLVFGEVIGVLRVEAGDDGFGTEERVLLEGLAAQVAGAIESARRYEAITELEVLKSDFIARVSHELRTPIAIVGGFVETLLASHDTLDADARRSMLERVDVAAARLTGLIDELLTLSRLEAGVIGANVRAVNLADALDAVRRQSASPECVELEVDPHLVIETDRDLLVRALGFVVDNALKYAGSCRVVARLGSIEVIDRGPGIAPADRSRVFERFARATADTSIPGMGVGLPMARTLLAAAGADLAIADPLDGVGTRMVVRFWG